MRLTKIIHIEADKLTADLLERLVLGESLTAHCESVQEFNNARQNAYNARRNKPRPDGNVYDISISGINSTVKVTVAEPKI
ncbi:MAG: hypothetical protein HFJ91_00800 [Muribaculaceae bacterium]|nr:hypothetical protein [Muribaculaceae bacterium]